MDRGPNLSEETLLDLYLKEIGNNGPLNHQQEAALASRIRAGDRGALERLILSNLRFVVSVARNYQHQGMPLCDLVNEGNLGLIRAASMFDEGKNFKFISYAVWWVRQAILQALARQSRIVNLPLNRVGTLYKIGQAQKKLEQKYHRRPEIEEIARAASLRAGDVRDNLRLADPPVSLDAPIADDDTSRYMDIIPDDRSEDPDRAMMELSLQDEIAKTLDALSKREQKIIKLYFGLGDDSANTLDEIGERFHLTRERTRQIKENALRRLRQPQHHRRLRAYA
jgi:RNA polymerase primary sigma factor